MVWKRNFTFLICFGSVFASVIIFKYMDDHEVITIRSHSQSRHYFGDVVHKPGGSTGGNYLNNRQLPQGTSIPFDVLQPYQNLPHIYRKEETVINHVIEFVAKNDLSQETLFNGNASLGANTRKNDTINASVSTYKSATSNSNKYSRVFQWNDKEPDGWTDLPLSKGEIASKEERIIFNRVGKCGSRSMINLLKDLAQKNNFNLISSIVYNQTHISNTWEKHIISVLDKVQTPYMFQRHLHYINFKRHNASEVVYINIIREPIPRMVSQYYFSRFGDGAQDITIKRAKWTRSREEFDETIDECVRNIHRDCSGHKNFYIIPFFCGNSKRCTTASRWALRRAIYNVEKHFMVVGILEEFELTLKVLEQMLPQYFDGAIELYQTPEMASNISKTSTSLKIPPSNKTLAILRSNMKYEYQFYEFIKRRLYKQKQKIGL